MKCAVIGAGAWGTALAHVLAENGHDVAMWALEPDVVEAIEAGHGNPRFLPGIPLHRGVRAFHERAEALQDAELVVMASPSHALRAVVEECHDSTRADARGSRTSLRPQPLSARSSRALSPLAPNAVRSRKCLTA